MQNRKYILIITTLLLLILPGCGSSAIISTRVDTPMQIDGNINDWGKALNYIEDEKIGFGTKDDGEFLYLCFTTRDLKRGMHFLRTGISFYIDPEKNSCTYFGAKILNKKQDNKPVDHQKMIEQLLRNAEFEIVNKDDEIIDVFPLKNKFGIKTIVGFENSQFVCEIKIPLKQTPSTPYATCTAPGQCVQVGIISGIVNRDKLKNNKRDGGESMSSRGSGRGSGNRGAGMGGRGGGKSNRSGNRSSEMDVPESLEYWIDIKISE